MDTLTDSLTFDDVLLIPQYSALLPSQTDVSTSLSKNLSLEIPILSAAMDSVTECEMAVAMARLGGLGIIHRNLPPQKQMEQVALAKKTADGLPIGGAVEAGEKGFARLQLLLDAGVDAIVLDTAHGDSRYVIESSGKIKEAFPDLTLIVGNIVTAEAAKRLADAGVDAVKVGVGPGSICTTRIVAGVGVPQLSAILNVAEALKGSSVTVIADGGMRYSGDVVKALAAGAHGVMLGGMLAGTKESPGEVIQVENKLFKKYRGMGSLSAMQQGSADRYFQKSSDKLVPEGVEGLVPFKGTLADVVFQIVGGLRAGLGYMGAENIRVLHKKASFTRITAAGKVESHPHNLLFEKTN